MTRTILWTALSLLPLGCLGDPASGGETLTGGSGGGSMSGGSDGPGADESGGAGACGGDAEFAAAWGQAVEDASATVNGLDARASAAMGELSALYMLDEPTPAELAAQVQAAFASVIAGEISARTSRRWCIGSAPAAEASAQICDPEGAPHVVVDCEGNGGGCTGSCASGLFGATTPSCDGTCWGACQLEASAACEGICHGDCEGSCTCTTDAGECAGRCDGMCTGTCELAGEGCGGTCLGWCESAYLLDVAEEVVCLTDAAGSYCEGLPIDCEGIAMVGELSTACARVSTIAGVAAAECAAPYLLLDFEVDVGVDAVTRTAFKAMLEAGRPAVAELVAVADHLDLLLGVDPPDLCVGAEGEASTAAFEQLRVQMQQQRDEVGLVLAAFGR